MKKLRFENISIIGDSILRGVVLSRDTMRYSISDGIGLGSLAERYSLEITNLSRFGCTVPRGYECIEKQISKGKTYDAALIELGGNDSDFNWPAVESAPDAEHSPNTPIEQFIEIYKKMIAYLKDHGIMPILTNLPPLCPERYFEWICRDGLDKGKILSWLGSINTIYRYQEKYSRTIERIAAECSCICIDLRGAFLKNRRIEGYFCEDGIHPNEQGQKIIRDTLIQTFDYIIDNNKGVIYA